MNDPQKNRSVGVIFDLDGTLIDTLEDLTDSMNEVFDRNALPRLTLSRTRAIIGEGLRDLIYRASGVEDENRQGDLVEQYRAVYRGRMLAKTRVYAGVPEMLDALTRLGVPMAVLSNKSDEFAVPICKALLSAWPFVRFRGSRDAADRKPDPTTALELAEVMGTPSEQVVFVGDSSVDIETARNAGMTSIAVTWGYRDREELEKAGPDRIVSVPREIAEWVERRTAPPRGARRATR